MTTHAIPQTSNVIVRVDYSDVAGAYAGWFLLVVQGDGLNVDSDGNPANGPDSYTPLASALTYYTTGGTAAEGTGYLTTNYERYRKSFLVQVHARLERMFGVGHSATWTATIIQGVTPAVIDDNW